MKSPQSNQTKRKRVLLLLFGRYSFYVFFFLKRDIWYYFVVQAGFKLTISLPQPPKVLGLQAYSPWPARLCFNCENIKDLTSVMTNGKKELKAPMWLFLVFFGGGRGVSLEPGNGVNELLKGDTRLDCPWKTHGSFTEIDVFCQVSNESEKNTVRSYTEVTEIGTQDEAREQEKLKTLSWALFSSMWCSTARKWEKTEGAECLRTEN